MARARPKKKGPNPAAWLRGRMGPAALAVLLAYVVFAPGVIAFFGHTPGADYTAGGYTRLVNKLIAARHWLVVDYGPGAAPRIKLADESLAASKPLQRFIRSSFLRRDMETADPAIWKFDNEGRRVEGVHPHAHRIIGPFSDVSGWSGDITFRGSLTSNPLIFGHDGSRRVLSLSGTSTVNFKDAEGKAFATAQLVGDQVVLRVTHRDGIRAEVDGVRAVTGDGAPWLRHWRVGETLTIWRGRTREDYTLSTASQAISTAQGGRLRTRYRGLESFASGVESAMTGADGDRAVATTLDAGFQGAAQRALETQSENLRGRGPAFPAAMLMMNALTGEVLAAATYPNQPEQLDARLRQSVQPPAIFTQNQNFVRLPIGSVAKAPIAMAILQDNPAMATFEVQPATQFERVLGFDLGGKFDDHVGAGGDGYIDFTRFLQFSSNKYAAALMLMALGETPRGAPPAPGEPYMLDGRYSEQRPRLPIRDGAIVDAGVMSWKFELSSLFDINPDKAMNDDAPAHDSRRLWGDLAADRANPFNAVSPELESFGLSDVRNIGADYVMTILGGNRSRWTTVKVAESFSRMVTRRRVNARLAAPAPVLDPGQPKGAVFISDEAWTPVMAGLKAAASSGTAAELDDNLPPLAAGDVRVFAKTGTPSLERYYGRTPGNRALQAYAVARCGLAFEDGRKLYLPWAPQARTARAFAAALARAPGTCASDARTRGAIGAELAWLNRRGMSREDLDFSGTTVVGVPEHLSMRPGMGHVIAIVVGVYADADTPDDQPRRALTIVVNIQGRTDTNRRPALAAALQALRDPLVRAWLQEGAPPPPPTPPPPAAPAREVSRG